MKKTKCLLLMLFVLAYLQGQDNPMAHWRFNHNTEDAAGNYPILNSSSLPCTYYIENTHPRPIERNGCLHVGDYNLTTAINCGAIDLGNTFSITGWFYCKTGSSGIQTLFTNGSNGLSGQVNLTNGSLQLSTSNGTTLTANSNPGILATGEFYHFVFLIDRSNGICNIYLNGTDETLNSTIRNDFNNTSNFYLGSNANLSNRITGYIDDYRIYSEIIGENIINTVYAGDPPGPSPYSLDRLRVSGNKIVNESGNPVLLKGICYDDQGIASDHNRNATVYEDFKKMAEWGANCIRMMVSLCDAGKCDESSIIEYCETFLDRQIDLAEYFGMYAVIDNHIYCQSEIDDVTLFWDVITQRYAHRKHVIYEIINEPAENPDGYGKCSIHNTDPWGTLKTTAEAAIDVIRSHDINAMVIVNGLNTGYDLREVRYRPIERTNVVYGSHPYPDKDECVRQNCADGVLSTEWLTYFGYVADTYPVIISEFGWGSLPPDELFEWYGSTENYWYPLRDLLSEKNIGYLIFYFKPNPDDDIAVLNLYKNSDGKYDVLSAMGSAFIEDCSDYPPTDFTGGENIAPYIAYTGIDGDLNVDEVITGNYNYWDINSDPEGSSTYKWYRTSNSDGSGLTEIYGATGKYYTITSADLNQYLVFEVIPEAATGVTPGIADTSACYGPVGEALAPSPDNRININFGCLECDVTDWYAVDYNRESQLRNGVSIVVPALLPGYGGTPSAVVPYDVGFWNIHHWYNGSWDDKEFVIKGLDPAETYNFSFLCRRSSNGVYTDMEFQIGGTTSNSLQAGEDFYTINNITPQADGSISIIMRSKGDHSYISAMTIEGNFPDGSNLIGHWPLDKHGNDASGNGNHMGIADGVCFDADMAKKGTHCLFNLYNANSTYLGEYDFDNSFALSMWLRSGYSNAKLIKGENEISGEYFEVFHDANNDNIQIRSYDGTTTELDYFNETNLTDYAFHHYSFYFDPDNNRVQLFVDGALQDDANLAGIELSDIKLWIAGETGNGHCVIDDVHLHNGPLSTEQINELTSVVDVVAPTNFDATGGWSADPGNGFYKYHDITLSWEDNSDNETEFLILHSDATFQPCSWKTKFADADHTSYLDQRVLLDHNNARVNYTIFALSGDDRSAGQSIKLLGVETSSEHGSLIYVPPGASKSSSEGPSMVVAGTELTYLAEPDEGWRFKEWTGSITSTDNPITITVNQPVNITAVFEEIQTISNTVLINFSNSSVTAGNPWNDITQFPNAGTSINNLTDDEGNATGINLTFLDSWNGQEDYGYSTALYPDQVSKTDYIAYNNDVRRIELSNLKSHCVFDISIYAARMAYDGITRFTINGEYHEISTRNNTTETANFTGIQPNVDGEILIECQSMVQYGHINAMVITERTSSTGNQAPVAVADAYTLNADDDLIVDAPGILGNDYDPNGDAISIELLSSPLHGQLSYQTDGSFEYIYSNDGADSDIFSYRISDGSEVSAIVDVQLTIIHEVPDDVIVKVNFPINYYPTPAGWNEMPASPNAGAETLNLVDVNGESTSIDVVVNDSWSGVGSGGASPGIFEDNVMKSYYYGSSNNDYEIVLSDLNQTSTYDLSFFASKWGNSATTVFTIDNVDKSIIVLDNRYDSVTFKGVVPVNGEISFSTTGAAAGTWIYLNAMTIVEHPFGNKIGREQINTAEVEIYPNPASENIFIDNLPKDCTLRILDITGQVHQEIKINNQKQYVLVINEYRNGTYILQIQKEGVIKPIIFSVVK